MLYWLGGLFLLFFQGCAQQNVKPVENYGLVHPKALYSLEHWVAEGRVAVRSPKESFSASLLWTHQQDVEDVEDVLELTGPFGQGRVRITVRKEIVIVDEGNRQQKYYQPVEKVFKSFFSVNVPVDSLRYWLLGVPSPGLSYELNNKGFLQAGWQVEYSLLQKAGSFYLPKKMRLNHQQVKIKIIVDQWNIK